VWIVSIGSEYTLAHPRVAGEDRNRHALQAQRPGCEQVKSAVPREIVNPGGGFEEDDRLSLRRRFLARNMPRHRRDLEIVESADQSALEALGDKFSKHGNDGSLFRNGF